MEDNLFIHEQTGLPNYHLLLDRLNMSIAYSRRYLFSIAVCYLRVKPPKKISEYSSNLVTQIFIKRLKNSIRDMDTIAKVGTYDYIILLVDINELTCREILDRIKSNTTGPYRINLNHIHLSVNIGVCIFPSGIDIQGELIALAKTQLFEAVDQGENQYSIYNGKLDPKAYRKVLIERDLPSALINKQLHLKYQPQFYLEEFEVKGVEALIRWKHPILGDVAPSEFIPIAESTGMISSIFFWSIEEIFKSIYKLDGAIKVSINITVAELLEKNFKNTLLSYAQKYEVHPQLITLEITENHKIEDVEVLSDIIIELKKYGFTVSLDDFGNGYFSFLDFIKLPVDIIKFDKQFVFSPSMVDEHINQSIKNLVNMAQHLSYKVVIEGIENIEQFLKWKEFNCDIIQGYYISKPLSLEDLIDSIKQIPDRIKCDLKKV